MRKSILIGVMCLLAFAGKASDSIAAKDFVPKISGLIRAKYEYNTSVNGHRFQVRNARFSLRGNIWPSYIHYKAEIDLSDEGEIKMLDAYISYAPDKGVMKGFSATIGQQKVPFSTENLRSPYQFYFANRSFIGKQMSHDVRDVGLKLAYEYDKVFPFSLSLGIYNGDGLYNQQEWQKSMNYAARLVFHPFKPWQISFSLNSVKPDAIRMNLYDVNTFVDFFNFHIESEYVYKQYQHDVFKPTHAFLVFASYDIFFKDRKHADKFGYWPCKISPLFRYDFMTDNNDGYADETGAYLPTYPSRQRLTAGITFSPGIPFLSDIRLNYEHYIYENPQLNQDNKLVLECVARF
ncbi:MAG: porin [Bacteroidetes bacterium]|uniref:Porin n=1 Tax=Candidatus Gallipaludibacter merdavium TaxID=2840839 RepID=A0A9D9HTV4_9BACT|nr:porin [Candidatus Gallipaludibacter merdavium]